MVKVSKNTYTLAAILSIIVLPVVTVATMLTKMFTHESGNIFFNTIEIIKNGDNGYAFNIKFSYFILIIGLFLIIIILSVLKNILFKGSKVQWRVNQKWINFLF